MAEAALSYFESLWDAITSTFSSTPAASPVATCKKGTLTPEQAQAWFEKFKRRADIPWNFPNDCCYNRAHVMAQELQGEGVDVGKAWNYAPDNSHPLRVQTDNDPRGYVTWGYHVAPTVSVIGADGSISPMVIDPSIAAGPITPKQWKDMQGQAPSNLVLSDATPYYRREDGRISKTPDEAKVRQIFDKHRADRAANFPPTK